MFKTFINRYKIVRKVMNNDVETRNNGFRALAMAAGNPNLAIDFAACDQFDKDLINTMMTPELLDIVAPF